MPRTTKSLRYFRCLNDEAHPLDLEQLVRVARGQLDTVASSEWRRADEVIRIQHFRDDDGMSLHFVRYVPGENSDTLTPGSHQPEDNEEPHPAPEGMEYKDGDFFMYCRGHDIVGCAHGMSMHHGKIEQYLKYYLKIGHIDEKNPDGIEQEFTISTALNLEKFRLIESHGVSRIGFSASAYNASYHERGQGTLIGSVRTTLGKMISNRLERLDDQRELEVMEDLVVEASLKLKGNTRADEGAQSELRRIAEESLDEDYVTIYTQKGEPIKATEIRMQTKVTLDKHGKSVYYDDVWREMRRYYQDLDEDGLLDQ